MKVHFAVHDTGGRAWCSFSANLGGRALPSVPRSVEQSCPRIGCAAVARRVEWTATLAAELGQRERSTQTSEQKNAGKLGINAGQRALDPLLERTSARSGSATVANTVSELSFHSG